MLKKSLLISLLFSAASNCMELPTTNNSSISESKKTGNFQNWASFALFNAIKADNKQLVQELVSKGADVNAKGADGANSLLNAILLGHAEIAKFLITQPGIDVNAADNMGNTPLLVAPISPCKDAGDLVKLLLDNYASPYDKDINGISPLMTAVIAGDPKIVKLFDKFKGIFYHTNNANKTALDLALESNEQPIIDLLQKQKEKEDEHMAESYFELYTKNGIDAKDDYGFALLHFAASMNKLALAKLLIRKGADINLKDSTGHTALDLALSHNYSNIY